MIVYGYVGAMEKKPETTRYILCRALGSSLGLTVM